MSPLSAWRTLLAAMAFTVLSAIFPATAQEQGKGSGSYAVVQAGPSEAPKALPGLGAPREEVRGPAAQSSGGFWVWIERAQREINGQLSRAIRDLKSQGSLASAGFLALLGFAYGVLHAAGPGHGKAVISSYVLANEKTVRRGIKLSFLAAFIQALSAIAIVLILYGILQSTSIQMRAAEAWIETLSWLLVASIGAWLLYRQVQKLKFSSRAVAVAATPGAHADVHNHIHDHGHHHHHPASASPTHAEHAHVAGTHGTCAHCGHAHMPDPGQMQGELGWRKSLAIAFSVGMRPCTGAIFVLGFALSQGMLWAGIFATFAMAFGTAITVSCLAALAVGSRDLAQRMAGSENGWAERIELGVGFAGSAAVFLLGLIFFVASLKAPVTL